MNRVLCSEPKSCGKLVYYVAVTLDGYIAGPDGGFDFFPRSDDLDAVLIDRFPETVPTHVRAELGFDAPNRRFDTVVMGRGTYQPALDVGVTSPYRHLRQLVVSTTTPEITDPEIELVRTDPVGVVRGLKQEGGLDIWLCGGGVLAGALLDEIDELIVKRYPVIAGDGIAMLAGEFAPTSFELLDTDTFSGGVTITTYRRSGLGVG